MQQADPGEQQLCSILSLQAWQRQSAVPYLLLSCRYTLIGSPCSTIRDIEEPDGCSFHAPPEIVHGPCYLLRVEGYSKGNPYSVQDLVVLNAALAELDESSADASCLQALNLAADRLSALLGSGVQMPPHLLSQVASQVGLLSCHTDFVKAVHAAYVCVLQQADMCMLVLNIYRFYVQIVAAVSMSKTLQKEYKSLVGMCVAAIEPQLDKCR